MPLRHGGKRAKKVAARTAPTAAGLQQTGREGAHALTPRGARGCGRNAPSGDSRAEEHKRGFQVHPGEGGKWW